MRAREKNDGNGSSANANLPMTDLMNIPSAPYYYFKSVFFNPHFQQVGAGSSPVSVAHVTTHFSSRSPPSCALLLTVFLWECSSALDRALNRSLARREATRSFVRKEVTHVAVNKVCARDEMPAPA